MRNLLEIELGEVWVEGEISNLRRQASGHIYFTLKDEGGQIPAVLFRGNARNVQVDMRDGLAVKIFAEVSLYEARGQVQLIVRKVEEEGQGDLQKRFEALKAKLKAEGLFEQSLKKQLPVFPTAVGLVTSDSGAALQDMLNVLGRRAPWVQPVLFPAQVQGVGAERGIAAAIERWNEDESLPKVNVIIVGRGGGSIEDLWNFNEEVVARAIAASRIPIVSAVGHETDFTIADFVADMRAPTPSAAAEMVVPDGEALLRRVQQHQSTMGRRINSVMERAELVLKSAKRGALSQSAEQVLREPMLRLDQVSQDLEDVADAVLEEKAKLLESLKMRHQTQQPVMVLDQMDERLKAQRERLEQRMGQALQRREAELNQLKVMLRTLGPESAFARGFSITMTAEGQLVTSPEQVESGAELHTRMEGGTLVSEVKE